jgi:hypothetical protein
MKRLILSAALPALMLAACAGAPGMMEVPVVTLADVLAALLAELDGRLAPGASESPAESPAAAAPVGTTSQ